MTHNVGGIDKVVRYVIGLVIIALGAYYRSWWGLIGVIPIATALFSFCWLYPIIGVSPAHKQKEPVDKPGHVA